METQGRNNVIIAKVPADDRRGELYARLGCRAVWLRTAAGLLSRAAPRSGGRVLDLCCGSGELAFALCDSVRFSVIVGVDRDEAALSAAKIRAIACESRGVPAPIFITGDALCLPFADAELDAAGIAFGLSDVADKEKVLSELYRVIRPGATLVLLEHCSPDNWWRKLLSRLQFHADAILLRQADRAEWRKQYEARLGAPTAETLSQSLQAAGFAEVRLHRFVFGDVVLAWGVKPKAAPESSQTPEI